MSLEEEMAALLATQINNLPPMLKERVLNISIVQLKEQLYESIIDNLKYDLSNKVLHYMETDESYTLQTKEDVDTIAEEIADTIKDTLHTKYNHNHERYYSSDSELSHYEYEDV